MSKLFKEFPPRGKIVFFVARLFGIDLKITIPMEKLIKKAEK